MPADDDVDVDVVADADAGNVVVNAVVAVESEVQLAGAASDTSGLEPAGSPNPNHLPGSEQPTELAGLELEERGMPQPAATGRYLVRNRMGDRSGMGLIGFVVVVYRFDGSSSRCWESVIDHDWGWCCHYVVSTPNQYCTRYPCRIWISSGE